MGKIISYFIPKRKLYAVPKHVSAQYRRGDVTQEQAILMMAGYARDPQEAQNLYEALYAQHGANIWNHVTFTLKRPDTRTFTERLLILFRRIFGESDTPNLPERKRRNESIVATGYKFHD